MTPHTRSVKHIFGALSCALAWATLVTLAPSASATEAFTAVTGPTGQGGPAQKGKAPKPKADKGTAEKQSERDKRLLRECRGRPNAGACEGYAS